MQSSSRIWLCTTSAAFDELHTCLMTPAAWRGDVGGLGRRPGQLQGRRACRSPTVLPDRWPNRGVGQLPDLIDLCRHQTMGLGNGIGAMGWADNGTMGLEQWSPPSNQHAPFLSRHHMLIMALQLPIVTQTSKSKRSRPERYLESLCHAPKNAYSWAFVPEGRNNKGVRVARCPIRHGNFHHLSIVHRQRSSPLSSPITSSSLSSCCGRRRAAARPWTLHSLGWRRC